MKNLRLIVVISIILTIPLSGFTKTLNKPISKEEIVKAQEKWKDGLIKIGKAYSDNKDYHKVAKEVVQDLYGYDKGVVLFKPTKASKEPFRLTEEGAISYFVDANKNFSEDTGFALQPWDDVKFDNAGFIIKDDYAVAMGTYYFISKDNDPVKVEYTFGYFKDKNNKLKINLHHSSLPYDELNKEVK